MNKETDRILLNSAELKFDKVVLEYTNNGLKVTSTKVQLDEENEVATIVFGETLNAGTAKLYIDYTGLLNDKLKGFYRSKYTHPNGEEKYAATTQFEVGTSSSFVVVLVTLEHSKICLSMKISVRSFC